MPQFTYLILHSRLWIILLLGLVACSGQALNAPTAAVDLSVAASTDSPAPVPTETRQPVPETDTPRAVSESALTASATPQEEVTPTSASKDFEGIPQGLTAAGFPYLGDPHAPVTLTDYSDFL